MKRPLRRWFLKAKTGSPLLEVCQLLRVNAVAEIRITMKAQRITPLLGERDSLLIQGQRDTLIILSVSDKQLR